MRLGGEVPTAIKDRAQRVESTAPRKQSFSASLSRSPQPKSTIETTKPAIGADLFSVSKPIRVALSSTSNAEIRVHERDRRTRASWHTVAEETLDGRSSRDRPLRTAPLEHTTHHRLTTRVYSWAFGKSRSVGQRGSAEIRNEEYAYGMAVTNLKPAE